MIAPGTPTAFAVRPVATFVIAGLYAPPIGGMIELTAKYVRPPMRAPLIPRLPRIRDPLRPDFFRVVLFLLATFVVLLPDLLVLLEGLELADPFADAGT